MGQNGAKLKRSLLVWKAEKHSHTHKSTTALDTWLEIHGGHLTEDVTACPLCPPVSFQHQQHTNSHKRTSAAQRGTFICHALQPSITTQIATETRRPRCRKKKKAASLKSRVSGRKFLCMINFHLHASGIKVVLCLKMKSRTVHTRMENTLNKPQRSRRLEPHLISNDS